MRRWKLDETTSKVQQNAHFKYATLAGKERAMPRHQFGRLGAPASPGQNRVAVPMSHVSPRSLFPRLAANGRHDLRRRGTVRPRDRPIADGEAESRMPPCGVSKWRLIAIEFYEVPWHLQLVLLCMWFA
jgi:hypothetical protein